MKTSRARIGVAIGALSVAAAWIALGSGPSAEAPAFAAPVNRHVVLSPVYTVDRLYRSMMGPSSQEQLMLPNNDAEPELVWITGYEAEMVGGDGATPQRQEFMCHSNLDLNPTAHRATIATTPSFSSRLFTLSQGQQKIVFPEGFGIPIDSYEALSLTTQVLNLNLEGEAFDVRHRVTLHYVRDREVTGAMTPLFPIGAYGLKLLEGKDGYYGVDQASQEQHGPGCLVGEGASEHAYDDPFGRSFTGHWVVPPGREVNRTLVTQLMRVPYDTTIHYIAVHLHPFAESLELRDLTAGTTVFRSRADNFEDRIGLRRVDAFSSKEGLPIFANHQYEMVSEYHNTTDEPQDSMAVMYIYLRDVGLERELSELRARYDHAESP